ncbi:MAG: bifunctional glutamate N-acetyltransferase/amino-acid acetyltransferase ArgJ, partial [Thermodesulfobacteriota bacterium]|nr:bifunctional glutamate N-acetyltransferase/amino-acid acetyltransferase ArgJ [Thermodesulfobacteriota bacterium]
KGFKTAGVASGLKKNGGKDIGLIYSEVPAIAAGVFTKNMVQAAPVLLDRERIKLGKCQAVIVNSGNANCCTGEQGMRDATAMAGFAASSLGISEDLVLVASTGVIGQPLDTGKIKVAMPELVKNIKPDGVTNFAEAIMTTDTVPKVVTRQGKMEGKPYTVTGVAKGSGMIRPDMATMLCFVMSDVKISHDLLTEALLSATDKSFNRITVDGDTSTNDTILVLANGLSGATVKNPVHKESFQIVLDEVLTDLAKMVVKDGEGATKLVEIMIKGALTDKDAYKIADTISNSNLVKTALFGEDANWGRILAAAGRAGVKIDPYKADIFFDDVIIAKNGMWCGEKAEDEAAKILKKNEFGISVNLNMGQGSASIFTCDFSVEYVKINADYRS